MIKQTIQRLQENEKALDELINNESLTIGDVLQGVEAVSQELMSMRMALESELSTSIFSQWTIEDVKSLDEDLTDAECMEVLEIVQDQHDAEVGINWDTIQYHIDELKGKK